MQQVTSIASDLDIVQIRNHIRLLVQATFIILANKLDNLAGYYEDGMA